MDNCACGQPSRIKLMFRRRAVYACWRCFRIVSAVLKLKEKE